MLETFEKQTNPLSEYERTELLPVMVACLSRHIGEKRTITNREMLEKLKKREYEVSEARIRKIINHIRVNDLIPCLIATSKGYYVAENQDEVDRHIRTLSGRIRAIQAVSDALKEQAGILFGQP